MDDRNGKKSEYEDIIDLPHPTSQKHPRMSLYDRAAQFSPFAALTGHDAAIRETARFTEEKIEQSEDMIRGLDRKLRLLAEHPGAEATVTYFVPDEKKSGGAYVTHTGTVRKIDTYEHTLVMADKTTIAIDQIRNLDSGVFEQPGICEQAAETDWMC